MVEITEAGVIYQSQTRMVELALEVCDIRNFTKPEAVALIEKGFNIYSSLQALEYDYYLSKEDRESIWYCLVKTADINDYPVAPVVGSVTPPAIIVGVKGDKGDKGERGADGGATDFIYNGANMTVVVDTFPIESAQAARWEYIITGTAQRSGAVRGTWTQDGSTVESFDYATNDIGGDTSAITLTANFFGGQIILLATINSGTWNISGSRYFTPNNGAGVQVGSFLTNGRIFIGNISNIPTEQEVIGDVTISNTGITSISNEVITNQNIAPSADIGVEKLEPVIPNRVAIYDSNGKLDASALAANILDYLQGLTGNVQDQIDNAATNITGAITSFVSTDATPDRVIVSNSFGKLAASSVSTSQITANAVPVGMIAIWSGSVGTIPGGWNLCDGTNGTRDLRNMFVVGSGTGSFYNVGDQGGAMFVTLTPDQMPSHTHTVNDPGHNHVGTFNRALSVTGTGTVAATDSSPGEPNVITSGVINSAFTGINLTPTGNSQQHENRPPYYALCYIQKI